MKKEMVYQVTPTEDIPFHNNVDYCVGTGRIGLALQKEYYDQLKLVQEEIGFRHIRGHGLFTDDMAIYHEYNDEAGETQVEYNFTYLDRVMDMYLSLGIRPFLELGFMPEKLASGTQTVFYWKGNTTPPKDYGKWCDLVTGTLSHLMERYGADEVVTWPVEVWNEPNLPGFWEHADLPEYCRLFGETFKAIKALDKRFKVGGPAICGVDDKRWMNEFLTYCRENRLDLDHVTRHHYTSKPPKVDGHYGYIELEEPDGGLDSLKATRDIVDSFDEYKGLPIHITEFNTSYIPNAPIHDTVQNAAFIAYLLSRLGDVNESYSYWTFGDVFEEHGVPFSVFHGGFGLVTDGGIPKPTFWTFAFYKKLQERGGRCVMKNEHCVVLSDEDGYHGVLWNGGVERTGNDADITLKIPCKQGAEYRLLTRRVEEGGCDPLKVWHDLGEPAYPDDMEMDWIWEASKPLVESAVINSDKEELEVTIPVKEFGVVYFELAERKVRGDRGFDYNRVI